MPHQCIHCSNIIEAGSREILEGCSKCGGKFFFYVRDEQLEKLRQAPIELDEHIDRKKVEEDVRSMLNVKDEEEAVILDLESIRVLNPGKFEIDLVSLMNRRPIVFKLEEGKYIIDLDSIPREKLNKDK
ncbi:MAG: Zn-ribbon containing protein [Nanoarchaeota archaeon]|nr:Zn-ribbon containing protein [Nanoarchaeota archaeon]